MNRILNIRAAQTAGTLVAAVALLVWSLAGCNEEPPDSLFDPNANLGLQPKITSMNPPSPGWAGFTEITFTGENFSPVAAENVVFFNAVKALILQASTTQLRVRAPNLVGDSIKIKITTVGSAFFSDPPYYYKLDPLLTEFGNIQTGEEPWGTFVDATGDIYVSMIIGGTGAGVKKFTPEGTRSDYAPAGGFTKWNTIHFGPDGKLYLAGGLKAILSTSQGTNPTIFLAPASGIGTVTTFDFDPQGNIWAAGNNQAIYRVKPDKNLKSFPLAGNIRSLRVYDGFVYCAGKTYPDSLERVVRCRIVSSDSLGPVEEYYNFSSSPLFVTGSTVFTFNFTSTGDMLIGTDLPDPIVRIRPDKSAETFYVGLFSPSVYQLVWGNGTDLFAVIGTSSAGGMTSTSKILKINAQVSGVP